MLHLTRVVAALRYLCLSNVYFADSVSSTTKKTSDSTPAFEVCSEISQLEAWQYQRIALQRSLSAWQRLLVGCKGDAAILLPLTTQSSHRPTCDNHGSLPLQHRQQPTPRRNPPYLASYQSRATQRLAAGTSRAWCISVVCLENNILRSKT